MIVTMATKNISKKGGNAKKVSTDADIMSKMAITKFVIGIVLVFLSIYMLIAFSSFLYCGAADYSMVEISDFGQYYQELTSQNLHARNICGGLGARIAYTFINQWFGLAAYLVPVYFILLGLKLIGSFRIRAIRTFILTGLTIAWLSLLLSALTIDIPSLGDTFYYIGGYSGMQTVKLLEQLIGTPGVYGVLALVAIFMLVYLSSKTIEVVRSMTRLERIKSIQNPLKNLMHTAPAADEEEDEEEDEKERKTDDAGQHTNDYDYSSNNGEQNQQVVVDLGTVGGDESAGTDTADNPAAGGELPFMVDGAAQSQASTAATTEHAEPSIEISVPHTEQAQAVADNDVALGFDAIVARTTPKASGTDMRRGDINTPYDPKKDLEFYRYPTLSLLEKSEDSNPRIDMEEQNANKERIIQVLHSFGFEISSIKATIGPTITLYEITPAEGMRISKIRTLEDDIALSLAAEGIRIIAPIPGKGTIGIEVPNKKKCIVSMESILNSKTYQESKMELPCALGKTITNEVFMIDLAKAPHLLVAGATGQGKSVGLNAIITSLIYKKHPSELKFVMVDPKKVEFSIYVPIENHFLAKLEEEDEPIITDVQRVVKTLNSLCKLMDTRYDLLKQAGVRNIKEYNEAFKARKLNPMQGHDYMPYYVVIIDEFGDLIMTAGKEIELPICRIAQLARAVGIHMVIATQRPTAQIVTGTIKANFPARIAFRVSAMMDSRVILDRPGANQLIGRGDMLYLNGGDPTRVQCAFVDTPEVSRICKYISTQQGYSHPAYLPEPDTDGGNGGDGGDGEPMGRLDPMFEECAQLIVSTQQGSTSMLQRNFSIGYNRAGKIMDQMQKAGIVGAQIGAKPREVLVQDMNTLAQIINSYR